MNMGEKNTANGSLNRTDETHGHPENFWIEKEGFFVHIQEFRFGRWSKFFAPPSALYLVPSEIATGRKRNNSEAQAASTEPCKNRKESELEPAKTYLAKTVRGKNKPNLLIFWHDKSPWNLQFVTDPTAQHVRNQHQKIKRSLAVWQQHQRSDVNDENPWLYAACCLDFYIWHWLISLFSTRQKMRCQFPCLWKVGQFTGTTPV